MIRCLAPLRKFPHSLQLVDNVTVPKNTEPIMQGSDLTRTLKFSTVLQNHLLKHGKSTDTTEKLLKICLQRTMNGQWRTSCHPKIGQRPEIYKSFRIWSRWIVQPKLFACTWVNFQPLGHKKICKWPYQN